MTDSDSASSSSHASNVLDDIMAVDGDVLKDLESGSSDTEREKQKHHSHTARADKTTPNKHGSHATHESATPSQKEDHNTDEVHHTSEIPPRRIDSSHRSDHSLADSSKNSEKQAYEPHVIDHFMQGKKKPRFFVLKCNAPENFAKSREKNIWATQRHNEAKFSDAYKNGPVIFVFSINNSRHFQGYAQMTSEIRNRESSLWSRDSANSWGGTFDLKWLQVHDLPFEKTLHLRNRLNANKPELEFSVGVALCSLIDQASVSKAHIFGGKQTEEKDMTSMVITLDVAKSYRRAVSREEAAHSVTSGKPKSSTESPLISSTQHTDSSYRKRAASPPSGTPPPIKKRAVDKSGTPTPAPVAEHKENVYQSTERVSPDKSPVSDSPRSRTPSRSPSPHSPAPQSPKNQSTPPYSPVKLSPTSSKSESRQQSPEPSVHNSPHTPSSPSQSRSSSPPQRARSQSPVQKYSRAHSRSPARTHSPPARQPSRSPSKRSSPPGSPRLRNTRTSHSSASTHFSASSRRQVHRHRSSQPTSRERNRSRSPHRHTKQERSRERSRSPVHVEARDRYHRQHINNEFSYEEYIRALSRGDLSSNVPLSSWPAAPHFVGDLYQDWRHSTHGYHSTTQRSHRRDRGNERR